MAPKHILAPRPRGTAAPVEDPYSAVPLRASSSAEALHSKLGGQHKAAAEGYRGLEQGYHSSSGQQRGVRNAPLRREPLGRAATGKGPSTGTREDRGEQEHGPPRIRQSSTRTQREHAPALHHNAAQAPVQGKASAHVSSKSWVPTMDLTSPRRPTDAKEAITPKRSNSSLKTPAPVEGGGDHIASGKPLGAGLTAGMESAPSPLLSLNKHMLKAKSYKHSTPSKFQPSPGISELEALEAQLSSSKSAETHGNSWSFSSLSSSSFSSSSPSDNQSSSSSPPDRSRDFFRTTSSSSFASTRTSTGTVVWGASECGAETMTEDDVSVLEGMSVAGVSGAGAAAAAAPVNSTVAAQPRGKTEGKGTAWASWLGSWSIFRSAPRSAPEDPEAAADVSSGISSAAKSARQSVSKSSRADSSAGSLARGGSKSGGKKTPSRSRSMLVPRPSAGPSGSGGPHAGVNSRKEFLLQISTLQGLPNFAKAYTLGTILGEGGYGTVRKCLHLQSGRAFACKVVQKGQLRRPKDLVQARAEYLLHSWVGGQEGVLAVEQLYEDEGRLYLVMQLCEAGDLFDLVNAVQVFSEPQAAGIINQLVHALALCHAHGIVHRDIKLENVLIADSKKQHSKWLSSSSHPAALQGAPAPTVVLADFGAARLLFKGDKVTGQTGGSLMYQSPELLSGDKYDFKADMWALGVVLFALLSGTFPFTAPSQSLIPGMIKRGLYSFSNPVWDSVSDGAKDLVGRLLEVDPSRRPSAKAISTHPWLLAHT